MCFGNIDSHVSTNFNKIYPYLLTPHIFLFYFLFLRSKITPCPFFDAHIFMHEEPSFLSMKRTSCTLGLIHVHSFQRCVSLVGNIPKYNRLSLVRHVIEREGNGMRAGVNLPKDLERHTERSSQGKSCWSSHN